MNANKQVIKTMTANFFGMIGSGVLQFGVALYILRVTGSSLSFAMTMVISPIVSIVLTPLAGHVVDRFDRKRIIGIVQVVSIFTLLAFAGLFTRVEQILQLVIPVLIILRIADMFFSGAYTAAMRGIVLDDQMAQLQSFLGAFSSVAGVLSPLLGAALYALLPMSTYILLVALCELIALLINLTIDFRFNPAILTETAVAVSDGVWKSFREGFAYIRTRIDLVMLALTAMLVNFLMMAKGVGVPLLLINTFGMSDAQYGMIQMATSFGLLVVSVIYGILKFEPKRPVVLLYLIGIMMGLWVAADALPALFGLSTASAYYYFLMLSVVIGGTAALVNIPMMTYMQKQVPEHFKGRVFTLFSTVSMGLTPISILLYGALYEHFPVSPILLVSGMMLIAVVTIIWLKTPKIYLKPVEASHDVSVES